MRAARDRYGVMCGGLSHGRNVPSRDVQSRALTETCWLFDHLVCAREDCGRHRYGKRSRIVMAHGANSATCPVLTSRTLTMPMCRLMLILVRSGAPPVRGKGAGSHPFEGTTLLEPFFRPASADIRRYGRKVVHEPSAHSRFLSRNAQER